MRATVISIGNELLSGITRDTNFLFLTRAFSRVGIEVIRHLTVGDQRPAMLDALNSGLADSELVVVSGGLGATPDDLTREVLAEFSGVALIEDEELKSRLAARYARFGRPFTAVARRQALLPAGWERLENPVGLAPGLWLERGGAIICALPGVPREFEAITHHGLLPRLGGSRDLAPLPAVTLRTLGIPESELAARIEDLNLDLGGAELAFLPRAGGVDLRIVGVGAGEAARKAVARIEGVLAERFDEAIYGRGEETIEGVILQLLGDRGQRLALAESCTGGLLGYRITQVAGSSAVFAGGVVAYANSVKESLLGVPAVLIGERGAVSAEVALAMAEGVLARFAVDVALAVTGVAGPGGGTPEKPVGLIYLGLAASDGRRATRRLDLPGDRHQIRERAAALALGCLRRFLLGSLRDSRNSG
jgi:nicotinamide-nucleotide amidase